MTLIDSTRDAGTLDRTATLYDALAAHLGGDPDGMPMLTETFGFYQDVNVQTGLDRYAAEPGRTRRVVGLSVPTDGMLGIYRSPTLAGLLTNSGIRFSGVQHRRLPCGVDE